ncbi:MAG: hypothetical protein WC011_00970 [Candidatus Paceibacterota bacterium]
MKNQEFQRLLEGTATALVEFIINFLKDPELIDGEYELSSEPSLLQMKKKKKYPTKKTLEQLEINIRKLVELKLKSSQYFVLETQQLPINELETLILDLLIDPSLLPESIKMRISLGKIEITNFIGQGETIEIK